MLIQNDCIKKIEIQSLKDKQEKELSRGKTNNCSNCDKIICDVSTVCLGCRSLSTRIVKNRPSKDELIEMVKNTTYVAVGKKYGVSDSTIRKWIGHKKNIKKFEIKST